MKSYEVDVRQSTVVSPPKFAVMVEECKRWGIPRTSAFKLARLRLIETFLIGRKRYVLIDSLQSLPTRLRAMQGGTV